MKLSEIYKIADGLAPKALSDEFCSRYGAYDNSGVLVDTGKDVEGIVFTLDLTHEAIDEAISKGANVIITHHPVIYGKISHICIDEFSPLSEKLIRCIEAGISVVSMHLNLDSAPEGIDESLQEGIVKASGGKDIPTAIVQYPLNGGGYGRVYDVEPISLGNLKANMQREFSTDRLLVYGNTQRIIRRVANYCGSGANEAEVQFACEQGADAIVSSDFKHHVLLLAQEKNLAVLVLTHYASENYGFKKYYEKISQSVDVACHFYTNEEML